MRWMMIAGVSMLACVLVLVPGTAGSQCVPGCVLGEPCAAASVAPEVIVMGPPPSYPGNPISTYIVNVQDGCQPLENALVEIEFPPDAHALIAWCGSQGPIWSAFTNANGDAVFQFFGSGCIRPGDVNTPDLPEVRATAGGATVVLANPSVSSPDVVAKSGGVPSVTGLSTCDPGTMQTTASVNDVVFHTLPVHLGLVEICSNMTPPYDDSVGVLDAVFLTPYLANSAFCQCQ